MPLPAAWAVLLLLLSQAGALFGAFLDDTYRNDGLSLQDGLNRSSVYDAVKRSAARSPDQQPVYFSLSQTLRAPTHSEVLALPVCLPASAVSSALTSAINAAFEEQLVQEATADTTYVQRRDECSYSSFVAYTGPTSIATAVVEAGKANTLCHLLPTYCTELRITPPDAKNQTSPRARGKVVLRPQFIEATGPGGDDHSSSGSGNPGGRGTPENSGNSGSSSGSPRTKGWLHRHSSRAEQHGRSSRPYMLQQSAGSTEPELPPVLHYNCQKHIYIQKLDHFPERQPERQRRADNEPPLREQHEAHEGPEERQPVDEPPHRLHDAPVEEPPEDHHVPGPHPHGDMPGPYEPHASPLRPPLHQHTNQNNGLGKFGARDVGSIPSLPRGYKRAVKRMRKAIKRDRLQQAAGALVPPLAAEAEVEVWEVEDEEEGGSSLYTASTQQQPQQQTAQPSHSRPGIQQASRVQFGAGVQPSPSRPSRQAQLKQQPHNSNAKSQEATQQGPQPQQNAGAAPLVAQKVQMPTQQAMQGAQAQLNLNMPAAQQPQVQGQQVTQGAQVPLTMPAMQQPLEQSQYAMQDGHMPFNIPVAQQLQPVQSQYIMQPLPLNMPVVQHLPVQSQYVMQGTQAQLARPVAQEPPRQSAPPPAPAATAEPRLQDLSDQGLFQQVYWVCDAAWPSDAQAQRSSGNVVVFLGNEAPLGTPQQPIIFENARRLNALVILIEHRYYGESVPFPQQDGAPLTTRQHQWLTTEQAIEDSVAVVKHVRNERRVPETTPTIVVGGSYGGMLAAYHRLTRPDVFSAAVAASAPVNYIMDTPTWADTSVRYHQLIKQSVDVMSGGTTCSDTITSGLAKMLDAGISTTARAQLARTFQLCDESVLNSQEAVTGLQREVVNWFMYFAQLNNQPPLLGQMALACEVLRNTTAAGGTAVEALAAVLAYFDHSGDSRWCYNYSHDPQAEFVDNSDSYVYQACREGVKFASMLPAPASASGTLNPEGFAAPMQAIQEACRAAFGPDLPDMQPPEYARDFRRLLQRVGGVVFTNGDLDGWAGGSLGVTSTGQQDGAGGGQGAYGQLPPDDGPARRGNIASLLGSANLTAYYYPPEDSADCNGDDPSCRGVAYVVYKNASHCTDTHNYAWQMPGEPSAWKQQRAEAMDRAAAFARRARSAARQDHHEEL